MSRQEGSFESLIESRTRGICIELLSKSPETTVRELQQLCQGSLGAVLSTITLGELQAGAPAAPAPTTTARPVKGAKKKPAAARTPRGVKAVEPGQPAAKATPAETKPQAASTSIDARTPAGRGALDEAVFAAIRDIGGPAAASEILKRTGGTNLQVRAACNRLIEAGRISWSGKARGTRYHVA